MMYLNADNNLEEPIVKDLEELLSNTAFLARPGYSLHILIDRHKGYYDAVLANSYHSSGEPRTTKNTGAVQYTYSDGKLVEVANPAVSGEVNMDSKAVLYTFLKDVLARCKTANADTYFLQASSHGAGWMGFGGDEFKRRLGTAVVDVRGGGGGAQKRRLAGGLLTNFEFADAIKSALADNDIGKLDMLGFDACIMSNLHALRTYHNVTRYLVASEATEPSHGWAYSQWSANYTSIVDIGKSIIDTFISYKHGYWRHRTPKTLALLDMSMYPDFRTKMHAFFDEIIHAYREGDQSVWTLVQRALEGSLRMVGVLDDKLSSPGKVTKSNVDFGSFLANFGEGCPFGSLSLKEAHKELLIAYTSLIKYFKVGRGSPSAATGVYTWLPSLRLFWKYYSTFHETVVCGASSQAGCFDEDAQDGRLIAFMHAYYHPERFEPKPQRSPRCYTEAAAPAAELPKDTRAEAFPDLPDVPPPAERVTMASSGCYDYPVGSLMHSGQIVETAENYRVDVLVDELVIAAYCDVAVESPSRGGLAVLYEAQQKFSGGNNLTMFMSKGLLLLAGSVVTATRPDVYTRSLQVDIYYFPPGTDPAISNNTLSNADMGKLGYGIGAGWETDGVYVAGQTDISLYVFEGDTLEAVPYDQGGKIVPILHVQTSDGQREKHVTQAIDWDTDFPNKVEYVHFSSGNAWATVDESFVPSTNISMQYALRFETAKSATTPCEGEVHVSNRSFTVIASEEALMIDSAVLAGPAIKGGPLLMAVFAVLSLVYWV